MTAVHSQRLPAVVVVVLSLSLAPARAEARAPELTGLGRQKYIKSYVDLGLKALEPKAWAQRSPKERMNAVMAAAQRQLKKIGVPTAKAVQVKLPPSVYGQFVAQDDWQLALNREVLHQDVLSREVAVELLDTVYHEVRHAEQWFRSARLRASLGATAHQIATEFRIPLQVTEHATKNPLHQRGRDAEEARQWYETLAGRHAKYHLRVLSRLKDRREASAKAYHRWRELLHGPQATTEDREQAKKEWHTAQQAYKAAYADYRRLPDEADAFVLGDAVKSECRSEDSMNWRERGWEFGIGAVIVLCVGITLQRRYHSPAESPPKPTPTTPSARPAAASEPGTAPPSLPSPPRPASLPIIEEIRHVCQMLRQERITAKQTLKLMGTTQEKPKPGKVVPFQPTNPLFDEGHVSCSFESRAPDAVALVLKDPQMLRLSDLRAVFGQDYVISPQHPDGPFFFEFLRNPHPEPIECILLARALLDFSMPEVEEARAREKAGIREFMIEDIDWPVQSLTMRRDALSD